MSNVSAVLGTLTSLAVLATACGPAAPDSAPVGVRRSNIFNGQVYSGHPAVGELDIDQGSLCTATLIGKKTVLTAGHCAEGSSYTFIAGGASYKVAQVIAHPSFNASTLANDIAVVILAQAPALTPIIASSKPPTVGQQVTLVGFGVTSEKGSDSGTKRIAHATISQVTQTRLVWNGASGGTCYGDSGGPAFATIDGKEVQVGVTSTGDPPCGTTDYDTRVDAFLSWIKQTAGGDVYEGAVDPPTPPADTQAPQVAISSPASGATVQASVTVQANLTDNVGVTRATLAVDGATAATLSKSPWSFTVALAAGQHTLQVAGYDAAGNRGQATVVVSVGTTPTPSPSNPDPATPTPGAFGASCTRSTDCASGLCAEDPDSQLHYCTEACDVSSGCPGGATCFPASGNRNVCGPPAGAAHTYTGELIGTCAATPGAPVLALWPVLALLLVWGGASSSPLIRSSSKAQGRASPSPLIRSSSKAQGRASPSPLIRSGSKAQRREWRRSSHSQKSSTTVSAGRAR